LRRRRLLQFLESGQPAWRDEGHPEMSGDAPEWVRQLRRQSEGRLRIKSGRKRR
jgi:hypothetical protein